MTLSEFPIKKRSGKVSFWNCGSNNVPSIGDIKYETGLCFHGNGDVAYEPAGKFERFTAWAGIDQSTPGACATFRAYVDGILAFDSGSVTDQKLPPRASAMNPGRALRVTVPLEAVNELRIEVNDAGSKTCAMWADPQLFPARNTGADHVFFNDMPEPEVRDGRLAATPPMGWNTWCHFSGNINEVMLREMAGAMVESGMRDAGYEYIIIDDHWSVPGGEHGRVLKAAEAALRAGRPFAAGRDREGNLVPDPKKFPSGMKALADYIHSKNLKLGIYSDAGILTCGQFPGSYGFEEQDARLFASWGIDFLKYDWWSSFPDQSRKHAAALYSRMARALRQTGRPIVFNACEWGQRQPWEWVRKSGGHMWRTTFDILDQWDSPADANCGVGMLRIVDQTEPLSRFAGPGGWNDMDQLYVACYGYSSSSGKRMKRPEFGLPDAEYRTQMSLWCIMAAPLITGCDLRSMNSETIKILTNPEVIAVNQDPLGVQGLRVSKLGDAEVWMKPLQSTEPGDTGRDAKYDFAVGLLNRGGSSRRITASRKTLGLKGSFEIRDLWNRKDLDSFADIISCEVAPHTMELFRLSQS